MESAAENPAGRGWEVPAEHAARFSWEYDSGRSRLLSLYQKGKDKQWDATERIDWSQTIDPGNPLGVPDELLPIYGSRTWDRIGRDEQELRRARQHFAGWQFSQFLHGEQGALITTARIVESVPDLDSKFYAATQTMDEARHVETFTKLLDQVGVTYPINPQLQELLNQTLRDSRWDMAYLGMQVLIEGLALAAFGTLRELCQTQLPKQVLAFVMQDEARHVAFGRLALKDAYADLTAAERADREEFVVEACYLMRDRLRQREMWEALDYDVADCMEYAENSPAWQFYRNNLFTRIVPCIRDIGLWGDTVQKAYADMGVLDYAGVNIEGLMARDEVIAESLDTRQADGARVAEVEETIAVGVSV